jgi:hypothetical protein
MVPRLVLPLERYISYGAGQVEWAVDGIGQIEHTLEEHMWVQMELHSSIDTQADTINILFGHLGFHPNA